jgi:hypothetical protein
MSTNADANTSPSLVGGIVEGAMKLANQAQAPQAQPAQPAVSNAVPYDRFQEVIQEKNQLRGEVENLKRMMSGIQTAVNPNQGNVPQINTVEDLVKYTEQIAEKKANERAEVYYNQYIAPIQQERMVGNYTSAVEGYFASDPEATSVRAEMDAYTATLSPQARQQLIAQVLSGDRLTLDGIKYRVMSEKQKQIQGVVGQNVAQQAAQAGEPTPFRVIKPEPQGPQQAFESAKKGDTSWSDFFTQLGPIPKS